MLNAFQINKKKIIPYRPFHRAIEETLSMYRAFRIVPQLHSDTPYYVKRVDFDKKF